MKYTYLFILGNNPQLAVAEIEAVLPQLTIIQETRAWAVGESDAPLGANIVMRKLGGTIKIGRVLAKQATEKVILSEIKEQRPKGKLNFGISYYDLKPTALGMRVKKMLKEIGISSRLVVSKEAALSSVVVTTNKTLDFLVVPGWCAVTEAVQDFKSYGYRDYSRPASDALSGMVPLKLARMMINLAQAPASAVILDPFCGSGTVLSEALTLGYHQVIGSDLSEKAVRDTKANLEWLVKTHDIKDAQIDIYHHDVRQIATLVASVDAIVTEPYLGPPIRGNERADTIKHIVSDAQQLYQEALTQFSQILNAHGRVVMIIPQWHIGGEVYSIDIDRICPAGLKRTDSGELFYQREDQKVRRQIVIWQKI
jgi:tRNA G10  N-methylase Trm11